jgi:hypothetical protein
MVHELLSFIAYDDDYAAELYFGQLSEQTVNQGCAIHWHHAFGVVLGVLAKPSAHPGCENDCLHLCKLKIEN